MALTNYLLHSLTLPLLFYGYGFGLIRKLGPAACLLVSLCTYGLLMLLSLWWLRRFRFGPAEWLWRSLTYWKPQPFLLGGHEPTADGKSFR